MLPASRWGLTGDGIDLMTRSYVTGMRENEREEYVKHLMETLKGGNPYIHLNQ